MNSDLRKSCSAVCPGCGSPSLHRSKRRGMLEHFLHTLLNTSPYRCKDCDLRFFRFQLSHSSQHSSTKHAA